MSMMMKMLGLDDLDMSALSGTIMTAARDAIDTLEKVDARLARIEKALNLEPEDNSELFTKAHSALEGEVK